jgi:hypothetical protein
LRPLKGAPRPGTLTGDGRRVGHWGPSPLTSQRPIKGTSKVSLENLRSQRAVRLEDHRTRLVSIASPSFCDEAAVKHWVKRLGKTEEEIAAAIEKVGPACAAIRKELGDTEDA